MQAQQQHHQAQHGHEDDAHQQVHAAVSDGLHEGLARGHAHLRQEERQAEIAQRQVGRHRHRPGDAAGLADLAQDEGHQQQAGKAQREVAQSRQIDGNGAQPQAQRRPQADADEADLAAGSHRIAEDTPKVGNVVDMGQHADLVTDLQRQVQRDADVLVDAAHVQEAGLEVQHPFHLTDGLARQLGVGDEEPQVVQFTVAAPEGVAHVLAQHLLGLGHALGVHAGDQHHVTQLQRSVHLGRMRLAVAIDGGGRHALWQPVGQLQERLAHHVAIFHAYCVHLQRNALLWCDPRTEEGVVQADDQDRDGHAERIGHRIAGGGQVVAGQRHGGLQRRGAGAGAGKDAQCLGQRDVGKQPDRRHCHQRHDHHADDRGGVGP